MGGNWWLCWESHDSGGVCVERMAIKPCSRGVRIDLLRIWIDKCAVEEQSA